jgi:hypothetical protein
VVTHHDRFVLLERDILDGRPICAISYLEPEHQTDSGFMLFSSPPDEIGDTDVMCLNCAIDEWPHIGRGLDPAREHGEVLHAGDEWIVS